MKPEYPRTKDCPSCNGGGLVVDNAEAGRLIREYRVACGVSLRHVAHIATWSPQYLSDLEHGRRCWTPEKFDRVARSIDEARSSLIVNPGRNKKGNPNES